MIISRSCPESLDTSEEGCLPLSYILIPMVFIILVGLAICFLAYRQHVKNRKALRRRNNDIDLQTWSPGPRLNLVRENSAGTDVSLPPSYHSTDEMLVVAAPAESAVPEQDIAEQRLPPTYTPKAAEGRTSVNFSRRSLRERRLSSNGGRGRGSRKVSPLRVDTSMPSVRVPGQVAVPDSPLDSLDLILDSPIEAQHSAWERRRV